MITEEHHKHSKIAKAGYGFFNSNEWSFVGTTCESIKTLADTIIEAISPLYKCGYADAKHATGHKETTLPGRLAKGAFAEYTEEIDYQQFNINTSLNRFHTTQLFMQADVVFINGNHFEAKAQVVIIDDIKKESLRKRIHQLTNVQLILLANDAIDIYDFIKETIPHWQQIPVYKLSDAHKIIAFFKEKITDKRPMLNGLVLAGGKSRRMGFDKSQIKWHGKEQKYFMADILAALCDDVFISSNNDEAQATDYKIIKDSFFDLGPYGALLSAFREQPDKAWLVVACDQPLLDTNTLKFLKDNRNRSSMATAFQSSYTNLPEPLAAIWEPKSYSVLLNFLSMGITCPRKVLINNYNISILNAPFAPALKNVNTPEDMEAVKTFLNEKLMFQSGS